jgi:hypothetical protein
MAKKLTLSVVTPVGTFTRTTARTYTHVVVVGGHKAALREARRLEDIASARASARRYREVIATNGASAQPFERSIVREALADGSYVKWAEKAEALAATLEASPITVDGEPGVIGWCGRPDLAAKLAGKERASGMWVWVRVFDVVTGAEVL